MPREKQSQPSPRALRWIGHSDVFVDGVPQSDLKVVDKPQAADEVSAGKAEELIATGLYAELRNEAAPQQEG